MRRPTVSWISFTSGLLAALALPAIGLAQPPGGPDGPRGWGRPHRGPGPERFLERHADELGLSEQARAAIEAIIEESRERSQELRESMRDEYRELHDLLDRADPDETAVLAKAEALGGLKVEAHKNRLRAMMAIRRQLTSGQRAELARIREERRSGRGRGPMKRCRGDLEVLCPDAEPGRATLSCLSEHWDELSEECREALEGGPRAGRGRGYRGPGG